MRDPVLEQNPPRRLLDRFTRAVVGFRVDDSGRIGQAANMLATSPLEQVQSCLNGKQRGEVVAFLYDVGQCHIFSLSHIEGRDVSANPS